MPSHRDVLLSGSDEGPKLSNSAHSISWEAGGSSMERPTRASALATTISQARHPRRHSQAGRDSRASCACVLVSLSARSAAIGLQALGPKGLRAIVVVPSLDSWFAMISLHFLALLELILVSAIVSRALNTNNVTLKHLTLGDVLIFTQYINTHSLTRSLNF